MFRRLEEMVAFQEIFAEVLEKRIRELIEEKHLYQRLSVGERDIVKEAKGRLKPADAVHFVNNLENLLHSSVIDLSPGQPVSGPGDPVLRIRPRLTNVKLFCEACREREAFAPIWAGDPTVSSQLDWGTKLKRSIMRGEEISNVRCDVQFLLILYQCQVCLNPPAEAFLIRVDRKTWNISIDGRSPIEHVEVPAFIPKDEQKFYRDALVAYQSGKTLAGLFYLRTLIEQFVRRQTGLWDRITGDKIMETYGGMLPEELSSRMPSLREWYEKLSGALHEVNEDAELFEKALAEINIHFDIRRVHRIPEKTNPRPSDSSKVTNAG